MEEKLWSKIRRQTPERLLLARKVLEEVRAGRSVENALRRNPLPDGGYLGKHMLVAAYRQLTESGEWQFDQDFLATDSDETGAHTVWGNYRDGAYQALSLSWKMYLLPDRCAHAQELPAGRTRGAAGFRACF